MRHLILILGDQLSFHLSSLRDFDPAQDGILMAEVMEEASYVPHHPKKIAFLFSAMRHFASDLEARGWPIRYVRLDEVGNRQSLLGELSRAVEDFAPDRVIVTEAGEWRLTSAMRDEWHESLGVCVELREDNRFLCSHASFREWAAGKKQLRMEFFYREMRRKHGLLMHLDGTPVGRQWNFDAENRKPPKADMVFRVRRYVPHDAITLDVLKLVREKFSTHFGDLEPFVYAVTARDAEAALDDFLTHHLPMFGDYQDAMLKGEAFLSHSFLSQYLNVGLLDPLDVCRRAEALYHSGHAPLNAVEGFIRQVLGWREFIRGLYWLKMPEYASMNALEAHRPLPAAYWGAPTKMACVGEVVRQTKEHAYSHHIQRLMVTGNFALLAGIDPSEVCAWYLAVYADAYEWVELPNTLGMALFGDGGIVGSKPYAASGKYIQRMSNFCKGCTYDVRETVTDDACPLNALYWHFLERHRGRFASNPRMGTIYANWLRMDIDKRQAILAKAEQSLAHLDRL
jgi:deoxyribodipyrimidine photolyase-related protein